MDTLHNANAKSMIVVGFRINRERSGESKRALTSTILLAYGAIGLSYANFVIRFSRILKMKASDAGYESVFGNIVDNWVKPDESKPQPPIMNNMLNSKPVPLTNLHPMYLFMYVLQPILRGLVKSDIQKCSLLLNSVPDNVSLWS